MSDATETLDHLAGNFRNELFHTLDGIFLEHEMTTAEAGALAARMEAAFRAELEAHFHP